MHAVRRCTPGCIGGVRRGKITRRRRRSAAADKPAQGQLYEHNGIQWQLYEYNGTQQQLYEHNGTQGQLHEYNGTQWQLKNTLPLRDKLGYIYCDLSRRLITAHVHLLNLQVQLIKLLKIHYP